MNAPKAAAFSTGSRMRSVVKQALSLAALAIVSACATGSDLAPQDCPYDYALERSREVAAIDETIRLLRTVPEDEFTEQEQAAFDVGVGLLQNRERVVDQDDLAIVAKARELMASEANWDRQDDRDCSTDDATVSLFCSLQFASRDVIGEYQHRRTGLQEVRFALQDATPGKDYEHRLRDFNNDPATTLPQVWAVLDTASARIAERLAAQERCEFTPPLAQPVQAAPEQPTRR